MLPQIRRIFLIVAFPLFMVAVGTVGYMIIEGWTFTDSFYMTAITLTTVGFGEVRPLSPPGRVFTVLLIFVGFAIVAYGIESFLAASLGDYFREGQVKRMIGRLNKHIIVCGYGRVGHSAVNTLVDSKRDIVIIERNPELVEEALDQGFLVVQGDATKDEVLMEAGIEKAWGLIVSTGDDSVNLFVVLSARTLNRDLFITVRTDAGNESKMKLAGADRVVSPYQIGGRHMANILIRPHVTDFLDVVTLDNGLELWLEELIIEENSVLVGKTVGESDIRRKTRVTLVAVLHHESGLTTAPDAETVLEVGDELIVLGTRDQLAELERLTAGKRV